MTTHGPGGKNRAMTPNPGIAVLPGAAGTDRLVGRRAWSSLPIAARVLVVLTAVVELASTVRLWDRLGSLGWVWIRPSAVPALLLVGVLRRRLVTGDRRWVPCCALAGGVIGYQALHPAVYGGAGGLAGFALAALQEEVVFRGVLPLVVWVVLERAGMRQSLARAVTLAATAGLFALQPNHIRQGMLWFFAFAVLFCLCVRRPDALLPAALAHLAFNLLSFGAISGATPLLVRAVGSFAVLGAFIATVMWVSGRRPALVRDTSVVGNAGAGGLSDWIPALAAA